MRPSSSAVAASIFVAFAATAYAQTIQSNLWVTNGPVYALASAGNTLYLGGAFTRVCPPSGGFVGLDNATSAITGTNPAAAGAVHASVPDGSGGYFIGGSFTYVQGQSHVGVAHVDAAGNVTAWNPGVVDGFVRTLTLDGNVLYMTGDLLAVNGVNRLYVAAVDASTGALLSWAPTLDGPVSALAVRNGIVYLGGSFHHVSGQPRDYLAATNAAGTVTSWAPACNGPVAALLAFSPPHPLEFNVTIFVGGSFTSLAGQPRYAAGALDASGAATSWSPNADHRVTCFAITTTSRGALSSVYAGGTFDQIGGAPRQHLARLDVTTGVAAAWTPDPDDTVNAIATDGSRVVIAGGFRHVAGVARNWLASVDASTGAADGWDPDPDDAAFTVQMGSGVTYAGGDFGGLGGLERDNFAALDVTTGQPTAQTLGTDGPVYALLADGPTIYVGGDFSKLCGQLMGPLGAIDGNGVPTGWRPTPNQPVHALAKLGRSMYVGGTFTRICNRVVIHIAEVDAFADTLMSYSPYVTSDDVVALATNGGDLYAGGLIDRFQGQARYGATSFHGGLFTPTPWAPQLSRGLEWFEPRVNAIALSGDLILLGGDYRYVTPGFVQGLAAFDTTGAITDWNLSVDLWVDALLSTGPTVFVGGLFTQVGGVPRHFLAALDARTHSVLAWNPNAQGEVRALALVGGTPYAAGEFVGMGGWPHAHVAGIQGVVTGIDDAVPPAVPALTLSANPSRGPLELHFTLAADADASIDVLDLEGRVVRRLDAGRLAAGAHRFTWDGRDATGRGASPGVYFVCLRAGAQRQLAKAVRLE